jgi:hypothetical protein
MVLKGSVSLLGMLVPFGMGALLVALGSAADDSFAGTTAAIGVVLSIFLGIPLSIVLANDYFTRAGVLRRQRVSSEVVVCEGSVEDIVAPPKDLNNIRREVGDDPDVVLELLVPSGLVWTINGRRSKAWTIASTSRTAETPDVARLAAQYVRPIETDEGTFLVHRRPLSDAEHAELRGYVPRLTVKAALVLTLMNVMAGTIVMAVIVRAYPAQPVTMLAIHGFLVTFVLWCDVKVASTVQTRWRMQRDLRERFVVIYRPDLDGAHRESVIEFLPYTRAEWTTGGHAAAWRRAHGRLMAR